MTLPNYKFNNKRFHRELQWTEMNTLGYHATEHEEVEHKETNDKLWKEIINNSKEQEYNRYYETVYSSDSSAMKQEKEKQESGKQEENDRKNFIIRHVKRNIFSPSPSFVDEAELLEKSKPEVKQNMPMQAQKNKGHSSKTNRQYFPACTIPKKKNLTNKTIINPQF